MTEPQTVYATTHSSTSYHATLECKRLRPESNATPRDRETMDAWGREPCPFCWPSEVAKTDE